MNSKIVYFCGVSSGFFLVFTIDQVLFNKETLPKITQINLPDNNKPNCLLNTQNINKKIDGSAKQDTITAKQPDQNVKAYKFSQSELMENIQAERRATLEEACRRLRDKKICPSNQKIINNRLFYSKNYQLASCDIPKCGYSSWLKAFFAIEGRSEEYLNTSGQTKNVILRSEELFRINLIKNKNLKQKAFDDSLKVILVRHPFGRIVSAFYDKMVPTSPGYTFIFGPMSQKINREYRHLRHNVTERNQTDNGSATFEDFVNFLVRLTNFDDHWKRFNDLCNPCSSQYDYIAKFETLNNDMEYLKRKINLTDEHRKWFFPRQNYQTNWDLIKKTFKKVPNKLAYRLYEVYREDFEVFGYSLPKWMC